jgi:hypothetical protein
VRDAVEDKAQWGKEAGEHVAEWRRNLDLKAWADEVETEKETSPFHWEEGDLFTIFRCLQRERSYEQRERERDRELVFLETFLAKSTELYFFTVICPAYTASSTPLFFRHTTTTPSAPHITAGPGPCSYDVAIVLVLSAWQQS